MLNDDINHNSFQYAKLSTKYEYLESKTPKEIQQILSPINSFQKQSTDFSQSLNAESLKQHLLKSIPLENNQNQEDSNDINSSPDFKSSDIQLNNESIKYQQQNKTPSTKPQSVQNLCTESINEKQNKDQRNRRQSNIKKNEKDEQEEYDQFLDDDQTLKKTMQVVNQQSLNYQTASFGGVLQSQLQKTENKAKNQMKDQLYTSMSDIGFSNKNLIITKDIRERMNDAANNWKIRTDTIDEISNLLEQKISEDPSIVISQSEQLMEFFILLLSDQNFKIVLSTLMIINKTIQLSIEHSQCEGILTSSSLGRYIPQLIKKLGDSKNIIRSEAIRALIGIFEIMKNGDKQSNNFVGLILPYLNNSSNWHIREELLNVLIICFLKSRNFYDFDAFQIMEAILKLFKDQKERIQLIAMEAIIAYTSIGNKFSIKEIIYQLADKSTYDFIADRMDLEQIPFINQQGALEFPYLDQMDAMGTSNNISAMVQPSRRESLSSNTQANKTITQPLQRGNSSGRRIVPPSANSLANYGQQNKRTVSANNNQFENEYIDYSPQSQSPMYQKQDFQLFDNQNQIGFLPSLIKNNSQQYNSYYSANNSMVHQQYNQKNQNLIQLKLAQKEMSEGAIYQQQ